MGVLGRGRWAAVLSRVPNTLSRRTARRVGSTNTTASLIGLYDIDWIISRTVSYVTVAIVVVALYAGVVTGLSSLIPNLPSIGVALARLAAAAVFLPVLRTPQRWMDRRFDRTAYDAQQVVEALGQRLRDGADPHTAAALLAAVDQTLQPTTFGVWTRR